MRRHPEVPFWLSVGDVADAAGHYQPFDAPLYWIKGNNENFDRIAAGDFPPSLHYLPNGVAIDVGGLRVAGLGGTFAPTVYDVPPADLPHPARRSAAATALADRRRHFVRAEVDACRHLSVVDVLLTHEAPRPFRIPRLEGPAGGRGNDAGKTPINEILAAMRPRLHLFGHHHRFVAGEVQGVPSICLDLVSRSYLLVDRRTLHYDVVLCR